MRFNQEGRLEEYLNTWQFRAVVVFQDTAGPRGEAPFSLEEIPSDFWSREFRAPSGLQRV